MLKSLELNGFKSFAKKSELEFGSLVTAIVGPNGSGKSNIVEAFRFVLGEQSIKSMRGKSGSDLIFKGSKTIAKLNRAKVSIVFDNSKKIFKLANLEGEQSINLDFDTIEISREVFTDGTNKYSINGTEIRLRDVHELLASVHIGSSGHHIISQGQADRLLSANGKERRTMVEDALGLKVYQIKIKDAEKRIEKTEQNIKEVESLRREINPHLRYLRKQVEKVKQAEELRLTLAGMYKDYLLKQNHLLTQEYDHLILEQNKIADELILVDEKLANFGPENQYTPNNTLLQSIQESEKDISNLTTKKDELSRQIARLEVMIEMSQKDTSAPTQDTIEIRKQDLESFVRDLNVFIDQGIKSEDLSFIRAGLERIRNTVSGFRKYFDNSPQVKQIAPAVDIANLQKDLEKFVVDLQNISQEITKHQNLVQEVKNNIEKERSGFYEGQRERFEFEKKRTIIKSQQDIVHERIQRAREARQFLEEEIREGVVLVGKEILSYGGSSVFGEVSKSEVDELRRNIERIKIKLEEAGASGGEEALKEYEEVSSRDEFLQKELEDLSNALDSLRSLISDLKQTLDQEFQAGIGKINKEFNEFFGLMFGGGSASLAVTQRQTKKKKTQDEETEDDSSEEVVEQDGVDIEISLPHKKVRELTMLSGGERSLTSIALLFAMSQVNPPPFLVLDETDAALDEANSRRYGDMIEKLSEYSQLIVVTHNRETMSRAKTLYGITVGADGASKLLSIKFNDAEQYAK